MKDLLQEDDSPLAKTARPVRWCKVCEAQDKARLSS